MNRRRKVVMSIHPHHAARIFAHSKGHEFRRVAPGLRVGDCILIYETSPVSKVTGEVGIEAVHSGDAVALSLLEQDPVERAAISTYLAGAKKPVAFTLGLPSRYVEGRSLADLGLRRAPQSYQFLEA